ncbi:hypothetical protein M0802_014825 [Mischocyttarus mexicanus]|nr:hypothetical protein M0802_014853 [Mischocyttarus mexicanus]KAI4476757.1 hypothetical protein M0802_014825 [Mischocyttarus mexicanus]
MKIVGSILLIIIVIVNGIEQLNYGKRNKLLNNNPSTVPWRRSQLDFRLNDRRRIGSTTTTQRSIYNKHDQFNLPSSVVILEDKVESVLSDKENGQMERENLDESESISFVKDSSKSLRKFVREHRAIENTMKNVVGLPTLNKNNYHYISKIPYSSGQYVNEENQEENENDENNEEEDDEEDEDNSFSLITNNQERFNKNPINIWNIDKLINSDDEFDVQGFLDEIKLRRNNGELDKILGNNYRQGRRRKLTSQQQGVLLVETLRKKRNQSDTDDYRGHSSYSSSYSSSSSSSDLQSGIMDMLGRSMLINLWKQG